MHYRLGFSSKLENSSVYIECSVRKPGVNHPIREIVKRFGKRRISWLKILLLLRRFSGKSMK